MQTLFPHSNLPGIVWPALPDPAGIFQLALLYQLEQSEKWAPEQLLEVQYRQLSELLLHAWKTCPFYRTRLEAAGYAPGSGVTPEWFASLPLLSRQDLQANFDSLKSANPPSVHGRIGKGVSSGSTGRPIEYLGTEHTNTIWQTSVLREHLWNQRDFSRRVCMIRTKVDTGTAPNWGPAIASVYDTSTCEVLSGKTPLANQMQWLLELAPDYLLIFPSNLRGLAEEFIRSGKSPPQMRQIVTQGEMLAPEVRSECEAFFNAPIRDIYSASEVGYIAIQCAEGHYHVLEHLLVEILDDNGQHVQPGQVGKVVITTLHNFAAPLIRYAIGDYAQIGDYGCECGRNLRKISRIMGRSRNLLTLPDGRRFWPVLAVKIWNKSGCITRFQVVQKTTDTLELRVEVTRPLTEDERFEISTALRELWGYPFITNFVEMSEMPLPENGKFEDFLSEIPA